MLACLVHISKAILKAWVQMESKRKDKGKTTMIEENSINDTCARRTK